MTGSKCPNEDRLAAVAQAWSRAAEGWKVKELASLYTPDALLFGGRQDHSAGARAIRAYFESYAGVILSASLELFDQHILDTGGQSLLAQGFADLKFHLSGNRETTSRMRTTLLLDWSDGGPRIRAHHFSPVPAAPPLGD